MTAATARETSPALAGQRRNHNLDALRGVAVLLVVVGHSVLLSRPDLEGRPDPHHHGTTFLMHVENVVTYVGASGVYLFFALSGYVITKPFVDALLTGGPLPSVRSYAVRRVFRIVPAYWLVLTFVVFDNPGPLPSGRVLLVHYLLLHNLWPGQERAIYFASWTLTLEALFYLTVPVVAIALRRLAPGPIAAQRFIVGAAIVGALSCAWEVLATQAHGPHAAWLSRLFPGQVYLFVPGIVGAATTHLLTGATGRRLLVDGPSRGPLAMLPVAVAGAALGVGCIDLPSSFPHHVALTATSKLWFSLGYGALLLAAVHTEQWPGRPVRLLAWFGVISYSLYLVHTAAFNDIQHLAGHIPGATSHYVVGLLLVLVISIPLSRLSWQLVEHPSQQLGGRIARRAPRRSS